MTVLSYQTLRDARVFEPQHERTRHASGLSYGLGPAGYDVRTREAVVLRPGAFALVSTVERLAMPLDCIAVVHDKSTLARLCLAVQNTVVEPGWHGYLTLELSSNYPPHDDVAWLVEDGGWRERGQQLHRLLAARDAYDEAHAVRLAAGQPVAQVIVHRLDAPSARPYEGRYQGQAPEPVPAKFLDGTEASF